MPQIRRQGLQFAPQIVQLRFGDLRHDDAATFHPQFEPIELRSHRSQGLIRGIEAVEALGVILVVQALRAQQQLQAA
jgi:hypothetical protein